MKRGDSKTLQIGQVVYAVGAPAGLELTISEGIISSIRQEGRFRAIQTSAPLSPGSSGGGLFDEEGRLVGITTLSVRNGQNLNFAVPVEWVPTEQANPPRRLDPTPSAGSSATNVRPKVEEPAIEPPELSDEDINAFLAEDRPPATSQSGSRIRRRLTPRWASGLAGHPPLDWSRSDPMYTAHEMSRYRTDTASWSSEGGFGLRWGMGPGDVQEVYPDMKAIFADPRMAEAQSGSIEQNVRGLPSRVFFHFLRGQLYSISIAPKGPDIMGTGYGDQLVRFWTSARKWRRGLRELLEAANGPPECAPTSWTVSRTCDDSDLRPLGCGPQDGSDRERLLRWVWRSARTETILLGGPAPNLEYLDLFFISEVRNRKMKRTAEWAERKVREAALEDERLTGRKLEKKEVASKPEHEEEADDVIPDVECLRETPPAR